MTLFKDSLNYLKNENQFVIDKLKTFFANVKNDPDTNNFQIAIPNWKFKVLMKTDESKAESLKKQWLEKGYLIDTKKRNEKSIKYYEINPYFEEEITKIEFKKINENWIIGFENITIDKLEEIGYYHIKAKLNKTTKKFRSILLRDFDEIIVNYLYSNFKSTVILSGSFIESILIYYCSKNKITSISYKINIGKQNEKTVTKDILDSTLNDLLIYFEQNNSFSKQLVHLGNVARLFRNFIHPGKEIKEDIEIDVSKSELCFLTVKEIINEII